MAANIGSSEGNLAVESASVSLPNNFIENVFKAVGELAVEGGATYGLGALAVEALERQNLILGVPLTIAAGVCSMVGVLRFTKNIGWHTKS